MKKRIVNAKEGGRGVRVWAGGGILFLPVSSLAAMGKVECSDPGGGMECWIECWVCRENGRRERL